MLFILYSISNCVSVVASFIVAFPALHVTSPLCVTLPVIPFIEIALDTVSVLFPAASVVRTCR